MDSRAELETLLNGVVVTAAKLALDMLKEGMLRVLLLTLDATRVLAIEKLLLDEEDIAPVDRAGITLDGVLDDGKLLEMLDSGSVLDDGKSVDVDNRLDDGKSLEDGIMLDNSKILDVDRTLEVLDDCNTLEDCKMFDADRTAEDSILEDGNMLDMDGASCEEAETRLVVEEDATSVLLPAVADELCRLADELCRLADDESVDAVPAPGRIPILVLPTSTLTALLSIEELDPDSSMLGLEMIFAVVNWTEDIGKELIVTEGDEVMDGAAEEEL